MKIHHIVPRIIEQASGPSQSVPALCKSLAKKSAQVCLHIIGPSPFSEVTNFSIYTYKSWDMFSRLLISSAMFKGLSMISKEADILHNHSLWTMPNIYPAWAIRGTKCRLFTSPRGTLSSWSLRRSYFIKRIIWHTMQAKLLEESFCLHATAESEYNEIRKLGLKAPVAIIPNGIDIPKLTDNTRKATSARKLLFLGRIHPKKGIEILLYSWKQVPNPEKP